MIYYENECVDCGMPCIYEACPHYRVKHYACDRCGDEGATLYHYHGEQVCENCILKEYDVVEGSDGW